MAPSIVDGLRVPEKSGLLLRAARLEGECRTLCSLPQQPGFYAGLERSLVAESIHASVAVAGNPMQPDDVRKLLERDPSEASPPAGPTVARARREVLNLALAFEPLPMGRVEGAVFGVSEGFVKKVHAVLAQSTGAEGIGEYADAHTQAEMLKLVTWANGPDQANGCPLARGALFHYALMKLKPFGQVDGRVARFFETTILVVAGLRLLPLMLPGYYHANVDRYLGFFVPDAADGAPEFVQFVLDGARHCLDSLRATVLEPGRELALRARFDALLEERVVKKRLHELLHLLPEHPGPFLLKDLFLKQPYRLLYDTVSEHTARRDLNKLIRLGLLEKDGTSYTFNRFALG